MRSKKSFGLLFGSVVAVMSAGIAEKALAATKDWNVGTGTWSTSGNWLPGGMPTSLDSVLIGSTAAAQNATVTLNVNSTIASLSLTDGMTLDTNGHQFTVGTGATISGQNSSGATLFPSRIVVDDAGANAALSVLGNLTLSNQAKLEMNGGKAQVAGQLFVDTLSSVTGRGVIDLTRNAATSMVLDGNLTAGINGLTINQNGTGLIDLDGGVAGDRTIDVTAGNTATSQYASLTINGTALADAFDDTIKVATGNKVTMNLSSGWTLGSAGKLQFATHAGAQGTPAIFGSQVTVNGTVEVEANTGAQFNCPVVFTPSSVVNISATGYMGCSGDHVDVTGGTFNMAANDGYHGIGFVAQTTYSGTSTFNGTLVQSNTADLSDNATVNATTLDLDGYYENTPWQISHFLTINTQAIDSDIAPDSRFNGTIDIYNGGFLPSGALTVNLPSGDAWTIAGTLNLHGNSLVTSGTLYGSAVHLAGTTNVTFLNRINARVFFDANSITNLDSGSFLRLDGGPSLAPNEVAGGIIAGQGTLGAGNSAVLTGFGIIGARINFDTGTGLLASGGTLQLSGELAHFGQIGALADGTLNLTQPVNVASGSEIRLYGGTVTGSGIQNNAIVQGYGLVSSASLMNNGSISALSDGLLTIDTVAAPDLDGQNYTGKVNAVAGNIRVVDQPTAFAGTVAVGPGHSIEFANGWSLATGGKLTMNGVNLSAIVKGSEQDLFGDVTATGTARFQTSTTFGSGSTINIPAATDGLVMQAVSYVHANATFTGAGKLSNDVGQTMHLDTGSNVNVLVDNFGTVVVDENASAIVALKSYVQRTGATLDVNIHGPNAGTGHDRVVVTNNANIAGTLDLSMSALSYDPAYGFQHEVLHTGGSLAGKFATITGLKLGPSKYMAVTYDADSVLVTAALPGDANLDGAVDFTDLLTLAQHYSSNALESWATGDFTGDALVNFDDLLTISQQYGNHLLSDGLIGSTEGANFAADYALAQGMVPEPSAAVALVTLSIRRRRFGR